MGAASYRLDREWQVKFHWARDEGDLKAFVVEIDTICFLAGPIVLLLHFFCFESARQ